MPNIINTRRLFLLLLIFTVLDTAARSNTFANDYTRSVHDIIGTVERQFGVNIKVETDTAGVTLAFADSRIRPYSVEETLNNILKPLNMRWEKKGERKYVVRPFHYPRRTFGEGKLMIDYLATLYSDRRQWEARRDTLKTEVRRLLHIDTVLSLCVPGAKMMLGHERKHDGYTVRNFALETLPGLYVCGSIYAPDTKGRHPLIVCPNGHFKNGRYNDEQQLRKGTLARMGAVCVDYDLVGWGESTMQLGEETHNTAMANTLQLVNGLRILDCMLQRDDIDTERVALNGGSGGGTQVIYLAMLDDRVTAACPTVNLGAHFDGGCACESGCAATRAASGTCHPEIAACFAPKPMLVVSDGGDWTANVPVNEFPYLQRVYSFYGKADNVCNKHLENERHDFGPNKRRAVYGFFADVFKLDASKIDESRVTVEQAETMQYFGGKKPNEAGGNTPGFTETISWMLETF